MRPHPGRHDFEVAAPLMCAGISTFNSLRNSGARSGDLVGIQGLGGLGHVAVQMARAMGFEVAAISRGSEKEALARKLGAHHYIDTDQTSASERLAAAGGAKVIMATAPNAAAISSLVDGLGVEGCLLVLGAPLEPLQINAQALISYCRRVQGWSSGTATDSTDTLAFAQLHGVKAMTEIFPLSQTGAAFEKMMQGNVRYRAVLQVVKN